MDIVKYLIVGAGCLLVSIILAIFVRNIFAGIGFVILSFGAYILWNYFDSVKNDYPKSSLDEKGIPPSKDN